MITLTFKTYFKIKFPGTDIGKQQVPYKQKAAPIIQFFIFYFLFVFLFTKKDPNQVSLSIRHTTTHGYLAAFEN